MLALKEGTTATTGLRLINMVLHASSTALLARAVLKLSINWGESHQARNAREVISFREV